MQNKLRLPEEAQALSRHIYRVFSRLVRLVIGTVSLPNIIDILRVIYVEEAQKKLQREGSKPTKSALALMTGLDTRVVSTILSQSEEDYEPSRNVNPENTLLDYWSIDPYFHDEETGKPAILPIDGRGRTFQTLVLKTVGRNITVKTVLDRLIASKNIRVIQNDIERVELLSMIYSPISSDRIKMTEFAILESSRVLSAAIHNMTTDPSGKVPQQGRWTYRLAPENYKEFRSRARQLLEKQIKEGEELLEEFEEAQEQTGQYTVGIGWYQWGDQEPEEEEAL
jgi:hypothetical protein